MTLYTLTCDAHTTHAKQRSKSRTDTLDGLRSWLIDQAQRWDWGLEGLQDLAVAVEDGTAAPATEDEIITIAARVWDEHPRHITLAPERA